MVKTGHKETLEKGITMNFLPPKALMIQMIMVHLLIKVPGSAPITAVFSYQQYQHIGIMIK